MVLGDIYALGSLVISCVSSICIDISGQIFRRFLFVPRCFFLQSPESVSLSLQLSAAPCARHKLPISQGPRRRMPCYRPSISTPGCTEMTCPDRTKRGS